MTVFRRIYHMNTGKDQSLYPVSALHLIGNIRSKTLFFILGDATVLSPHIEENLDAEGIFHRGDRLTMCQDDFQIDTKTKN